MERHTSTHTGAVFKVLICEHCNATFKWEETLDSHIFKNHPDLIASIKRKILECLHCTYKTTFKNTLRKHMIRHSNEPTTLSVCPECYASFKHKVSLHDHILRVHPDLKSFVKRKTHECTQCDYKTIKKQYLTKHMLKHAGIVFKPSVCEHCNASFNSKQTLDSHILRDHPDFVESIKSKIHECSKCSYKTIRKSTLTKHMLTHPSSDSDLIRCQHCQHCSSTSKSRYALDDHVVKKHPELIDSNNKKIYECSYCTYKTMIEHNFNVHVSIHLGGQSETSDICLHCKARFKTGMIRDEHIVKQHPDFVASVTRKIYGCSSCTYRTIYKTYFNKHMRTHSRVQRKACQYCTLTFKGKDALDDHVVKKHPKFFDSMNRKIYECSYCTYKTINKSKFNLHVSAHLGGRLKLCQHCTLAFKSTFSLKDHMVRKHPDFISSVKIYKCLYCAFKTINTSNFKAHIVTHSRDKPSTSSNCRKISVGRQNLECSSSTYKTTFEYNITDRKTIQTGEDCNSKTEDYHPHQWVSRRCNYCDLSCNSKQLLDDHVIRKHPEFISTVTTEIYECPYCPYKTTMFGYLKKHTPIHVSDQMSSRKDCCATYSFPNKLHNLSE
nr:unnamed protein product [Callosobruchus analis]